MPSFSNWRNAWLAERYPCLVPLLEARHGQCDSADLQVVIEQRSANTYTWNEVFALRGKCAAPWAHKYSDGTHACITFRGGHLWVSWEHNRGAVWAVDQCRGLLPLCPGPQHPGSSTPGHTLILPTSCLLLLHVCGCYLTVLRLIT